jgi:hypothetical protein
VLGQSGQLQLRLPKLGNPYNGLKRTSDMTACEAAGIRSSLSDSSKSSFEIDLGMESIDQHHTI